MTDEGVRQLRETCTCILHHPGDWQTPPEWEQNPFCRVHPDVQFVLDRTDKAADLFIAWMSYGSVNVETRTATEQWLAGRKGELS